MIKKVLGIFLLLAVIIKTSFSQNIDCSKIRNQTISEETIANPIALLETINQCLKLDSIDKLIFNNVSIATLIVGIRNQNTPVTYGAIMDMIQNVREDDYYNKTRSDVKFHHDFANKVISKKDSLSIWKGFHLLNPVINTNSLLAFIYAPQNEGLTYNVAYLNYLNEKNKLQKNQYELREAELKTLFKEFEYYEKALDSSKKANKNFIMYFTSYGDIHGRKFESTLLRQPQISQIIINYYTFYPLNVDDNSELDDDVAKMLSPLKFKNKGKYYDYLQKELINNNFQTILVIVNTKGKILFQNFVSELTEKELTDTLNKYKI